MDFRSEFERLTHDDFHVDPWLFQTFGKRYQVVLRGCRTESTADPDCFTFTTPYYAIPCETGVEITIFSTRFRGELAVAIEDNPELILALQPFINDPEW